MESLPLLRHHKKEEAEVSPFNHHPSSAHENTQRDFIHPRRPSVVSDESWRWITWRRCHLDYARDVVRPLYPVARANRRSIPANGDSTLPWANASYQKELSAKDYTYLSSTEDKAPAILTHLVRDLLSTGEPPLTTRQHTIQTIPRSSILQKPETEETRDGPREVP